MRKLPPDVARIVTADRSQRRHRHVSTGRRRRRARWPFVAVTTLVVVGLIVATILLERRRNAIAARPAPRPAAAVTGQSEIVAGKPTRPVYPYSVIKGGAHSAGDLQRAIAADPVVASHYRGFEVGRTRVVSLDRPRTAYVSYRIRNSVYWTKKRVVVPAGELVLTDGTHEARTRCGNQLSDVPGETSAEEPAAGEMDVPVDTPLSLVPPRFVPAGGVSLPPGHSSPAASAPTGTAGSGTGLGSAPAGGGPGVYVPTSVPRGSAEPSSPVASTGEPTPETPSSPPGSPTPRPTPIPPQPGPPSTPGTPPATPPPTAPPPTVPPTAPPPTVPPTVPPPTVPPPVVPPPVDPPPTVPPTVGPPPVVPPPVVPPTVPPPVDPPPVVPPPVDPPIDPPPVEPPIDLPPTKTVPEPGTTALVVVGMGLFGAWRARRRPS